MKRIIISIILLLFLNNVVAQEILCENYTSKININSIIFEEEFCWIATQGGIIKINQVQNSYEEFEHDDGLSSNYALSMAIDKASNKWIGTNNGVSIFDNENWTTYNKSNSDIIGNWIYSIAIDSMENVWIGTSQGVSVFDGTCWKNFSTQNSGLVDNHINHILIDTIGDKWFGTNSGISRFDGITWTTYRSTDGLPNNLVLVVALE